MAKPDDWMVIGEIAGPFGVRGEIKVELRTDFPERFARLDRIYVGEARREFAVLRTRRHQTRVLLTLEGISTPEAVARLRGQELAVPREEAIPLPSGHYYLEDVLDAAVVTTDGRDLGRVTDVLRTGGNDVFVVGRGPNEILIPSIRDAIRELDLAGRRIVVEPWVLAPAE